MASCNTSNCEHSLTPTRHMNQGLFFILFPVPQSCHSGSLHRRISGIQFSLLPLKGEAGRDLKAKSSIILVLSLLDYSSLLGAQSKRQFQAKLSIVPLTIGTRLVYYFQDE